MYSYLLTLFIAVSYSIGQGLSHIISLDRHDRTIFTAEIIEHPVTQYAVEGNNVTFHCKTKAWDAYWRINDQTVSTTRQHIMDMYEMQGFTFSFNESDGFYNLTIIVLASAEINNSLIVCRAASYQYERRVESKRSYLYVYRSYRKGFLTSFYSIADCIVV